MDAKYVKQIEQNDDWSCFICDKTILRKQRAEHWALRNFMIKQLEKIRKITVSSEEELNVLLNEDVSTCCPHRKKKIVTPTTTPVAAKKPMVPSVIPSGKRRSATPPAAQTAAKKIATNQVGLRPVKHNVYNYTGASSSKSSTSTAQPTRSAFIGNAAEKTMTQPKKNNDEIVCTPDLPGFFGADESPAKEDPPPLAPMRAAAANANGSLTNRAQTMVTSSGAVVPIFHNVNGYQIDLNHAARQEVYRLPNGKLIQVRKTNPPAQASNNYRQIRPAPPQQIRNLTPMVLNGNGPRRQIYAASGVRAPSGIQIRPHMRPSNPGAVAARFTVSSEGRLVATPSTFPNNMQAQQQVTKPVVPAQSSIFTQQNGSISVARASYPKTPFGAARNEFEDRIISALEICQHTINKMITLTNSTSFKTANNFKDLKDLYTHLQYLFTYTTGKLTNFNDSLKTSIESLVKKDQLTREKTDIDELEILEKAVDVIDVLSDDDEPPTVPTVPKVDESTGEALPAKVQSESTSPKISFPSTNIHQKDIPLINEDDLKNEMIKEIVENDKRLMARNAVKLEKIDDSKNLVVQRLMKAIHERKQAMETDAGEDDVGSDKEPSDDVALAIEENGVDTASVDVSKPADEVVKENENQVSEEADKSIDNSEGAAAECEKEGQENSETVEKSSDTEMASANDTADEIIDTVELSSDEEVETNDKLDNPHEDSNKENVDGNGDETTYNEIPESTLDIGDKPSHIAAMEIDSELPTELMEIDESIEEETAKETNDESENNDKDQVVEPANVDMAEPEKEETIVEPENTVEASSESVEEKQNVVDEEPVTEVATANEVNLVNSELLEPVSPEGSLDEVLNATGEEPNEKIDLDGILEGLNKITDKSMQSTTPSKTSTVAEN